MAVMIPTVHGIKEELIPLVLKNDKRKTGEEKYVQDKAKAYGNGGD